MKKILFLFFSLIISCSTFAQITVAELQNLEVRMMPFDVRLRTAPYTIQTISKNKPLTTEVLKEYIVAGSNLKFIAQDMPGLPVGNNTDARIIVSENGNSITLRPRAYLPDATIESPAELYHIFASIPEKKINYLYKTNRVWEKTEAVSISNNSVVILSGFDNIYSISGYYRYLDVNNIEHTINIDAVSTEEKIVVDIVNKTVTVLPFACPNCNYMQYEINIKYTKPFTNQIP
jgi:hypothetical protein